MVFKLRMMVYLCMRLICAHSNDLDLDYSGETEAEVVIVWTCLPILRPGNKDHLVSRCEAIKK